MKTNRSIRPGVETLESKALLSTVAAPHFPSQMSVAPIVVETAQAPLHLIGVVVNGYGGVSPLGRVRGYLNIPRKILTLVNPSGSLKLQLIHVHKYPYVINAYGWKIMSGTGDFASLHGSGHSTVSAVVVLGRTVTWTAAFYV